MAQGYFAQPYTWPELAWCLIHNAVGPSSRHEHLTSFLPRATTLNVIEPRIRLAFAGDILPFPKRSLTPEEDFRALLAGVDYLVANFEGTILTSKAPSVLMGQIHTPAIVETLARLHPPSRTVLCCANNHSGDFGRARFENSCRILRDAGFLVFGARDAPTVRLDPGVSIAGGTLWSNRVCDYLARFEDHAGYHDLSARFNIFCPHWGYEMQLYPSPAQIEQARALLARWDLIAGHHSHCPQPVTGFTVNRTRKLLAYSTGDLLYRYRIGKYLDGVVLRVEIGPREDGTWAAGRVAWRFSRLVFGSGRTARLCAPANCRYFPAMPAA